jgi:hypothetical protein
MLILRIISGIALVVPIVWAAVFVFLFLLSKSLDWLGTHYGTEIRRLLKQSPKESSDYSGQERGEPEYLVYLHYSSQYAAVVFKRIGDAFHIHINPVGNSCDNQYSNARPKGFVPRRPFPSWRPLSHWHIRNIVGRLKRAVNQSGKEPPPFCYVKGNNPGFCCPSCTLWTFVGPR